MAETEFHILDRLQWRLSQAEDDIERLKARIAALEGGTPLPPQPQPEFTPSTGAPQALAIQPTVPQVETPIPDITVGWVGGRRT